MESHSPSLSPEAIELVAARFRVLGEASRLRLLQTLRSGEQNVTALVTATGLTQANTSRHLQTLADAGLVGRRREGSNVVYFVSDPAIFELCDLVCGSLQRRWKAHAEAFASPRPVKRPARSAD
jgi:DNA-binding transcriptional ArsR family regulator